MARIELRYCDIILRDGCRGTAAVADASIMDGDTTLNISGVSIVDGRVVIPVGAHFRVGSVDQKYTVTGQDSNKVWTVTVDATGGHFKLTFNGQQTASISEGATAAAVQTALEALSNVSDTPGTDLVVSGSTGGPYAIEAKGAYAGLSTPTLTSQNVDLSGGGTTVTTVVVHAGATTWQVTISPPLDGADLPVTLDAITILPRELNIKIGDGDLTYTEHSNYTYDLDRGLLDDVRTADEAPMDVALNFVYEHITSGTNEAIAPMDAIKRKGTASDWINAASDVCEPYAIDLLIVHTPPCGTAEKEFTLFPDFRSEQRDVSFKDSNIKVTGKCNVIEPITWRGDETNEPA